MTERVRVGVYHEKRGEDRYTVYKSGDGDVVQIEHYDARAAYSKYQSVNLWSAEAPALINLIEKAAGIKNPAVEYEYGVEQTSARTGWKSVLGGVMAWVKDVELAKAIRQDLIDENYVDSSGEQVYTYKVIRREVPKSYEYVKE